MTTQNEREVNEVIGSILGKTSCNKWVTFLHPLSGHFEKKCNCKNCYPIQLGPPDYFNSLDACAEFEDWSKQNQFFALDYQKSLWKVVHQREWSNELDYQHSNSIFRVITATPQQRCEAFLRLHNRWPVEKESK